MLGIAALAYAAFHFSLYVGDQKFDLFKVGSEIALRIYLTIGFLAVLGLTALAATSTDAMVRRPRGQLEALAPDRLCHRRPRNSPFLHAVEDRRHRADADARLLHPADVLSPAVPGAACLARLARRGGADERRPDCGARGRQYGLATGVPARPVLTANLQFPTLIRPFWIVLGTGLVVLLASSSSAILRGSRMAVAR